MKLNKNNVNHLWRDGILKGINEVIIAFKLNDEGEKPSPTYQEIRFDMSFDIKMEHLWQMDRCVEGGHATAVPPPH